MGWRRAVSLASPFSAMLVSVDMYVGMYVALAIWDNVFWTGEYR